MCWVRSLNYLLNESVHQIIWVVSNIDLDLVLFSEHLKGVDDRLTSLPAEVARNVEMLKVFNVFERCKNTNYILFSLLTWYFVIEHIETLQVALLQSASVCLDNFFENVGKQMLGLICQSKHVLDGQRIEVGAFCHNIAQRVLVEVFLASIALAIVQRQLADVGQLLA